MLRHLRSAINPISLFLLSLALLSALPGSPLGLGEQIDRLGLRLWYQLFPPARQQPDPNLQLVELPSEISAAATPSWVTAHALGSLLEALQQQGVAAVGITANLASAAPAEAQIMALLPPGFKRHLLGATYRELLRAGSAPNVIWRLPPSGIKQAGTAIERESRWPLYYNAHQQLLQYFLSPAAAASRLPITGPQSRSLLSYPLDKLTAGFELSLLSRANPDAMLRWRIPDLLQIGAATRNVSPFASLRPWPQESVREALAASSIDGDSLLAATIDPAISSRIQRKIVLLGHPDDTNWLRSASRLNALMTGQYSYSPWWQALPLTAMTLMLWGVSIYAMKRWSCAGLATGTLLPAILLLALAIAGQQAWNQWLACGDLIVCLLTTGVLLVIHRSWHNWRLHQRLEADDARLQLATLHLEQDNPEAAFAQLQRNAICDATLSALTATAESFAGRGNTPAAAHTYRHIQRHAPYHCASRRALEHLGHNDGVGTSHLRALPGGREALKPLGRYQLIRRLGSGAMGEVFLAEDPKIGRQVAIKTMQFNRIELNRDEARKRFFREAETAGKLEHPHIVSIYDVGEQDDLAYIAMEYVPGSSLADHTDTGALLELDLLYSLMEQAASALEYAHHHQVVHRDIKPGNLLFNPSEQSLKIADFGIARLTDGSRTRTSAILGSPFYMSPEQLAGTTVGPASDLYSLGVTFYQLLSGTLPFEGDSLAQLAWQITHEAHPSIGRRRKGLPRSAARIVNQALHKEPGERFSDATAMADAFHKGARSLSKTTRKAV